MTSMLSCLGNRVNRARRIDWFPVEAEILFGTPHGTLLVDVGGGEGHDLEQLLARFRLA